MSGFTATTERNQGTDIISRFFIAEITTFLPVNDRTISNQNLFLRYMKKTIIVTLCFSLAVFSSIAQKALVEELNRINSPAVALAPIRFLASDELMGRATLRPEINVAARYISEQFRSFGVKEVPGTLDYFQSFDIKTLVPALGGSITINQTTYELGKNFIVFRGSENITITAPVVFAGYGTKADFNKVDVKGKIVVTRLGKNDSTSSSGIRFINAKRKLASEKGALTLIELYTPGNTNWDQLTVRYMAERIRQEEAITLPVFIINDEKNVLSSSIQNGVNGTIHVIINSGKTVVAKNVMGWVEGTDPQLKKEFIVVSSHYDHLGISRQPKMEEGKLDSIYNGARDNAIGTAAVIGAARYFSQHPAKRSILFIAYTGEEIGLVGSKYFAEHPTLPLHQLVYNLNNDNANYNDTTIVTVVALERTSAAADIKKILCGLWPYSNF
jgi:hypothetical protein